MFIFAKLFEFISSSHHAHEQRRREAWLAQSSNLAELESRMRQLDRGETQVSAFGDSIRIR